MLNPDLGEAQLAVFRADKRSTSLSPRVHEMVILTVGAAMRTAYEIYAHRAVPSSVGLSDAVIDAIASGDLPQLETDQETRAYEFTWQLVHNHQVDSSTYTAASNALGQRGL